MVQTFDALNSSLEGTSLVEASAGTGKTYTICNIYLRLLLEQQLNPKQIVVVTFTNAATAELKERIHSRLLAMQQAFRRGRDPEDSLIDALAKKYRRDQPAIQLINEALKEFDEASILTIHGFCQQILKEFFFETGTLLDTELVGDQSELLETILFDYWRLAIYPESPTFVSFFLKLFSSSQDLLPLVRKFLAAPQVELLHPPLQTGNAQAKERELEQLRLKAKSCFDHSALAIRVLWENFPGLSGTHYRSSWYESWFRAMHAALSSLPDLVNFIAQDKPFSKFTAESLKNSLKKGFDEPPQHEFFQLCDEMKSIYQELAPLYDQAIIEWLLQLFNYVKQELSQRKQALNIHFYDDLLQNVAQVLKSERGEAVASSIRETYKVALIDEFQDTDTIQYEIFHTLYAKTSCPLFFIGDPKQSIYGFRGADIFTYLAAQRSVDNHYTLDTNWRSSPQLLTALNTLFLSSSYPPFVFAGIQYHPVQAGHPTFFNPQALDPAPLQVWYLPRESAGGKFLQKSEAYQVVAEALANEIVGLLHSGLQISNRGLKCSDIAILIRSHAQAKIIQTALREKRIKSLVYSQESLFDSAIVEPFKTLLESVIYWYDPVYLKRGLLTFFIGYNGNQLFELNQDEEQWTTLVLRFQHYYHLWLDKGLMFMFQTLLKQEKIPPRLMAQAHGERYLTDLSHLIEILHTQALEKYLQPVELLKWLEMERRSARKEDYLLHLESEADAVKIYTIHKSKGLEFPIVFCPFLDHVSYPDTYFTFHDESRNHQICLELKSESYQAHQQQAQQELLAEDLRLFYVAVTRAKYRCYVAWGAYTNFQQSALGYLLSKPESNSPSDAELLARLEELETRSQNTIKVTLLPLEERDDILSPYSSLSLNKALKFKPNLDSSWLVTSFSGLIASKGSDGMSDEKELDVIHSLAPVDKILLNSEAFPRGAQVGNCLHDILEMSDFANLNKRAMGKVLAKYGLDSQLLDLIYGALTQVVETCLLGDHLQLKCIPSQHRINEMPFYFSLQSISVQSLSQVFKELGFNYELKGDLLEKLQFTNRQGLMTGFIDLVFLYQGQYFLVDYKSNFLGDNYTDYQPSRLQESIDSHYYFLQYLIYTVALHNYLQQRIPNYTYDQHFGGIFYLYLRGLSPSNGSNSGIFYDKPAYEVISRLSEYLIPSEHTPP